MPKGRVLMPEMNSALLMKTSDLLAAGNLPFILFFEGHASALPPQQLRFLKLQKYPCWYTKPCTAATEQKCSSRDITVVKQFI